MPAKTTTTTTTAPLHGIHSRPSAGRDLARQYVEHANRCQLPEPEVIAAYRARVAAVEAASAEALAAPAEATAAALAARVADGDTLGDGDYLSALTAPLRAEVARLAVEHVHAEFAEVLRDARPVLWQAAQDRATDAFTALSALGESDWIPGEDLTTVARQGRTQTVTLIGAAMAALETLESLSRAVALLTGRPYAALGEEARIYRNAAVWIGRTLADRPRVNVRKWMATPECLAGVVDDLRQGAEPWLPTPDEHEAAVEADRLATRASMPSMYA